MGDTFKDEQPGVFKVDIRKLELSFEELAALEKSIQKVVADTVIGSGSLNGRINWGRPGGGTRGIIAFPPEGNPEL